MTHITDNISLRDHLAASALPAIIERDYLNGVAELRIDNEPNPDLVEMGEHPDEWGRVAIIAYAVADAMIEARNQS